MTAACSGELRDPIGVSDPARPPIARSDAAAPLIGAWRVVILIQVQYGFGYDLQQWTTTWQFNRESSCRFTRTTFSFVEGITRTVVRDCTFTATGSLLRVTFTETGITQELPYSFPAFNPDRLMLEGVEYQRVR